MGEALSCLITGATGYIGGRPRGLAGHAYWWTVWPFHGLVFGAVTRNIATAAERSPSEGTL